MKAIVTFTERPGSELESKIGARSGGDLALGVRLLAEGANDRLLLRMLEMQYPAMRRVADPGASIPSANGEPCVVEVPMPEDLTDAGPAELCISSMCSLHAVDKRLHTISATHSSRGSVIRRAELLVRHPDRWRIAGCRVNGRTTSMRDGRPLLGDVPRGALVELDVERIGWLHDDDGNLTNKDDDGVFRATIAGELRIAPRPR